MLSSIDIQASDVFYWNNETRSPVVINQGGSYSGKTYNILIVLFCRAITEANSTITVVSQDVPHLKAGALRDAEKIVNSSLAFQQEITNFNKTDRVFFFRNGSMIEFKSLKDAQDAHGGKREYLFVNEANGIPFEIYTQLALRTSKQVFIDYNPQESFWVHENLIGSPGVELFISDHRHNPFVEQSTRDKIEDLKNIDPELWKVYGRGLTGKFEGLIYSNYHFIEKIPDDAVLVGGCLDWGYSNDPSAFLLVYKRDNDLFINELIYETGLTNQCIAERLRSLGVSKQVEIVADSAEPKSISELSREGFFVAPAEKGADSIRVGIDVLKRYSLNITQNSHGIKKEIKRYKWKIDRDGKSLNQPVSFFNHSLDALRYLALNKLRNTATGQYSWI